LVSFGKFIAFRIMKINKHSACGSVGRVAFLIGGILLLGCNNRSANNKKVFRYNESRGIATLDPAFAKNQSIIWMVHQLYNTLVQTDSNLQVVPSLAASWEVTADRLTYSFHLRSDVLFQDDDAFVGGKGRKLLASDVVFSFQRLMDPNTASSGAWIFNNRVDPRVGFIALNDSVFQLKLLKPFNPILGLLTMQYCSIVPREVVAKYGKEFRRHPCGTGPFRLKSWEEGQDLILLKNEHYFEHDKLGRGLPYLDAVKVRFFDNKATEFLLFRQGELDFINDIDPSFKDEVISKMGDLKKDWKGKIILSKHPYLNTEYLGILFDSTNELVRNSPLKIKQIRQAINYGFDRRKMMMYLRNSIGEAAESGFVPRGMPSFDSALVKGYDFNPTKARELLTVAGFPAGSGLPQIKLMTIENYADLAGFIANQLGEVGIPVQVEVLQQSLLLEETAKSQALFFLGSWIADYPDAENFLSVFYSSNPAPPNYTRYHNAAFDRLYERSLGEKNDSFRMTLYRQMDQLMMEDAPVVPLWYDEVIRLVNPAVKGFQANGLNLLDLRSVDIVP
jgi:oligopeptide transport system substrate-binding protein